MLDRVLETIRRHAMVQPGQRIGIAVSGGADSICLLYVLRELAADLAISLSVLHLNHQLRGADSDRDADFVRELAASLGTPFHGESAAVALSGDNLEQAGREARRAFFSRLSEQGLVDRIATGHTRSDQAETVLYRLLRGSGTAGLSGILPVTAEGLIRPLLNCTRADVLGFLTARNLAWREDSTNQQLSFARNRIRHELLPLIEREYSPAATQILAATSELARSEEDYWDSRTAELALTTFKDDGGAIVVRAEDIADLHPAVLRRLLRRAVCRVKGDLRGIDIAHIDRLVDLVRQPEGHGRVQVPGLDVFRSFEWLRIARPRRGQRQDYDYSFPVGVRFPKNFRVSRSRAICLELLDEGTSAGSGEYNEEISGLDWELLASPLELRNWHPGDEFQPVGRSKQKIKQLFQEAHIPIWERQGWPLITSGGVTVWTRRFGAAQQSAPSSQTRRVLRVHDVELTDSGPGSAGSAAPGSVLEHGPRTSDDSRESNSPVSASK